jgi:Na+/H+ antiporter NhaA
MKYGIIFWCNLSKSGKVFTLKRNFFKITICMKHRISCSRQMKKLEILPAPCQYILLLMTFIVNNEAVFKQIYPYTVLIQGIKSIICVN